MNSQKETRSAERGWAHRMRALAFTAIMMLSVIVLSPQVVMPAEASDTPSNADVFAGDAYTLDTTATGARHFRVGLVSDTQSEGGVHRAAWTVAASQDVDLTFNTWTTGTGTPLLPDGTGSDHCRIRMVPELEAVGHVEEVMLHDASTCPTNGQVFQWTTGGAGTWRIVVEVADRDGISGNYDISSDGGGDSDRGALRVGLDVESIVHDGYPSGSVHAYTVAGESMASTITHSAVSALASSLEVRSIDASNAAVKVVSLTPTGSSTTASFVLDDTYPAKQATYGIELEATGVSPLTGVPWTHIESVTNPVESVDEFTVRQASIFEADPRIAATHLLQVNDDAFGTPPLSSAVANNQRLQSDLGFRAVRFTNAREEGVNGLTFDMELVDVGLLVDPVVSTGLTTTTEAGEDGWGPLRSWSSALPGGEWRQTVDITAPATMDADTHVTGNGSFQLLANDPGITVAIGAGDPTRERDSWAPPSTLLIVGGLVKDHAKVPFAEATFSIARFNSVTGTTEYLDSINPSVWSTGSSLKQWPMAPSPGDPDIAFYQFAGSDTEDWTGQDLAINVQVTDEAGTPYSGVFTLSVHVGGGADPVTVSAAPAIANPGESVRVMVHESFLDGEARIGNAAGTTVVVYKPDGTVAASGSPTEIGFGSYRYTYALGDTPEAGAWDVIAHTTDSNTGAVNSAATTFFVEEDGVASVAADVAALAADQAAAFTDVLDAVGVVEGLVADVDGDVASFRTHYDSRQTTWESTFDAAQLSIETLIRSEQNATETLISTRYSDRTTYLDALKESLDTQLVGLGDDVAASQTSIEALLADLDSDVASFRTHYDTRQDAWEAAYDADYASLVARMDAEHNDTKALVVSIQAEDQAVLEALWSDYNATAANQDAALTAARTSIESLLAEVDGDVASFRTYYTGRQDTWETTFDSAQQSIETLVRSEQNATETFLASQYIDRSTYLDALKASLDTQLTGLQTDIAASQSSIEALLADLDGELVSFRSHYDTTEEGAALQAATDYDALVAHVTTQHNQTKSLVVSGHDGNEARIEAFWADYNATAANQDADLAAARTSIETLLTDLDGDVASFRTHYDSRQTTWESTFDAAQLSIETLIRGEQNATETFLSAKYSDRTTYLDALKASLDSQLADLDADVAASQASIEAAIADLDADVASFQSHYNTRQDAWEAAFDADYASLVEEVKAQHNQTRALVVAGHDGNEARIEAFWADYNATAANQDADLAAARTSIETLLTDLDGDVASFRAYYGDRQTQWEATFDSANKSIHSVVQSEQNNTEAFLTAQYSDRTTYLDAVKASLDLEHAATRTALDDARDTILSDAAAKWTDWNTAYDNGQQLLVTTIGSRHNETQIRLTQGFANQTAYHDAKWQAWNTQFQLYQDDEAAIIAAFRGDVTADFQSTWNRLDAKGTEAQEAHAALQATLDALWMDHNITANADKAAILQDLQTHQTSVDASFQALLDAVATDHTQTRATIQSHHDTWNATHGAWLQHFALYWLNHNATAANDTTELLNRIDALEDANQIRFNTYQSYIEGQWSQAHAQATRIEQRTMDFEDRLNATLAGHFAALLSFQDLFTSTLAKQRGLVEGLWMDLNTTQDAAMEDREARYHSILGNLTSSSEALEANLQALQDSVLADAANHHNASMATLAQHDASIQALIGASTQSAAENFTALTQLTATLSSDQQDLVEAFWSDTNTTWQEWMSYYDGATGASSGNLSALIKLQHNQTRNQVNFTGENYFAKYGGVVQDYSGALLGTMGEGFLTNRAAIEDGRDVGFMGTLWMGILVQFAQWGLYLLVVAIIIMLGVNRRSRKMILGLTPVARAAEVLERRREAKKRRAEIQEMRGASKKTRMAGSPEVMRRSTKRPAAHERLVGRR